MPISKWPFSDEHFFYLSEVLGMSQVLIPAMSQTAQLQPGDSKAHQDARPFGEGAAGFSLRADVVEQSLLFVVGWNTPAHLYSFRHGPRGDLLQKMLLAMQISQERISYVEIEGPEESYNLKLLQSLDVELQKSGARFVLVFAQEGAASLGLHLNRRRGARGAHLKEVAWGELMIVQQQRWLVTYDPQLLLDDPKKKRDAWNHLKILMHEMH